MLQDFSKIKSKELLSIMNEFEVQKGTVVNRTFTHLTYSPLHLYIILAEGPGVARGKIVFEKNRFF